MVNILLFFPAHLMLLTEIVCLLFDSRANRADGCCLIVIAFLYGLGVSLDFFLTSLPRCLQDREQLIDKLIDCLDLLVIRRRARLNHIFHFTQQSLHISGLSIDMTVADCTVRCNMNIHLGCLSAACLKAEQSA